MILDNNCAPTHEQMENSCAVLNGRDEKLLQWITDSGLVSLIADNVSFVCERGEKGGTELELGLTPLNFFLVELVCGRGVARAAACGSDQAVPSGSAAPAYFVQAWCEPWRVLVGRKSIGELVKLLLSRQG